jgi:peptidoglycan hydrolase-like protein with peptidoglycan-binding domain
MALASSILSGNSRLDQVASGAPSVKKAPPNDDVDAVQRIQRALVELGFALPQSFPSGATGQPDGIFGSETYRQVIAFQKQSFPGDPNQWDGRVGRLTLGKMDQALPSDEPIGPMVVLPESEMTASRCCMEPPSHVGSRPLKQFAMIP